MTSISMLDKLKLVLNLSENVFNIAIIVFMIFISFLFITTNKNNRKSSLKAYIAMYIILFAVILIRYYDSLPTMFDYFMDNVFDIIYFPNIAVYIGFIILSNIIMLVSIFSTRTHKYIKTINVIISGILDYIFVLFVSLVNAKKINVFNIESLYSNRNIHTLIELSSNIFILWIVFLIIFKIVISIIENNKNKKISKVSVEHIGGHNDKKKLSKMPDNIIKTTAPMIIKREEPIMYDSMFTLDDYKHMLSILESDKENVNKKIEIKEEAKPKKRENHSEVTDLIKLYSK